MGAIGIKGTGKTTIALKEASKDKRVIVFDSLHLIHQGGEHRFATTSSFSLLIAYTRAQANFRVMFLPSVDEDRRTGELESVLKLAALLGNITVVVDEIDLFCDPGWLPDQLKKTVNYGRHPQVSLIYTARQFSQISRELTSQTDTTYFFRQEEPIDVDGVRRRIGDAAERVITLPNASQAGNEPFALKKCAGKLYSVGTKTVRPL